MLLVHAHLHDWDRALPECPLAVDRSTLAKRRWRGVASDGAEFGFDLEHPLDDQDVFAATPATIYRVVQKPETVLEVLLGADPAAAVRLGWRIGNLHFPLGLTESAVLVADDPALRQLFERERVAYVISERVFRPLSGGHRH